MPAVLTKHGADRWGRSLNIRQHDDHIARLQRHLPRGGRLGQQLQQLVVQHFQLTHQTVRTVKDDGLVLCSNIVLRLHGFGVLSQRQHVSDAALHLLQQTACISRRIIKQIYAWPMCTVGGLQGVVVLVEQAHIVAALAAPCGQQWVGMGMHGLQRNGGQVLAVA